MKYVKNLWLIAALAAFLPASGFANPVPPAPGPAPALEEKLLESLADIFRNFDVLRAVASHPSTNLSDSVRAKAYNAYVSDLQSFGLVPNREFECLISLTPPVDEKLRAELERSEIRLPSTRFLESDPCYPRRGRPNTDRPFGWQFDEDAGTFYQRDGGGSAPAGEGGRGGGGENGDGRGGGTTGGVGRGRGN